MSHSLPSGSLATTTPAPPAPPNGAIPLRIEVKMARPLASLMTAGGIFRSTLRLFFLSLDPSATFSSVTTPSTGTDQRAIIID